MGFKGQAFSKGKAISVNINTMLQKLAKGQKPSSYQFQRQGMGRFHSYHPSQHPRYSSIPVWLHWMSARCHRNWHRSDCSSTPSFHLPVDQPLLAFLRQKRKHKPHKMTHEGGQKSREEMVRYKFWFNFLTLERTMEVNDFPLGFSDLFSNLTIKGFLQFPSFPPISIIFKQCMKYLLSCSATNGHGQLLTYALHI